LIEILHTYYSLAARLATGEAPGAFVVDIVERLDLKELESCYGGGGKQPYHPALLLALLFYGYATGVFSSSKLEQVTHDSVAFRFITGEPIRIMTPSPPSASVS
jgi:transposase